MNNKNEVFEYLIDQLRQQVNSNPYKQQCEDLVHEVQSLKNQLRDMSALVAELQRQLAFVPGDASEYIAAEQSGCRKEGAQRPVCSCVPAHCGTYNGNTVVCDNCGGVIPE